MMELTKELRNEVEMANQKLWKEQEKIGFGWSLNIVSITYCEEINWELKKTTIEELQINWSCVGSTSVEQAVSFAILLRTASALAEAITEKYSK